jgi:exonuclease SbcD
MRFLHASDLHIDSPLRGLDRYDGAPVERLRTATRGALERLVDLALAEHVDFVLLAGDIYDRDWQDFHTGLFFREQMVRLDRASVRVFIIQGNHDAQGVITRQLTLPGNVTVFSSRTAETHRLEEIGVAVHGRSFPNRAVDEDLVPSYPAPVPDSFNIGVLHTSLTGRVGHDTYAPTDVATLTAKGYDYWALGHVHAREVVSEEPRIVFPGNLQGRHANETGPKGCELVTVEVGRIESEFVPLDVARWTQVTVPLDGVDRMASVAEAFRKALGPLFVGAADRLHAVRVILNGSTTLHQIEAQQPGTLAAAVRAAAQDISEAEVWVEQVRLELSTPMDRAQAAQRQDAVGELVRLVDAIAGDDAELKAWGEKELGELLGALPPEVAAGDVLRLDDLASLRNVLTDAEGTVLARLSGAGGSG